MDINTLLKEQTELLIHIRDISDLHKEMNKDHHTPFVGSAIFLYSVMSDCLGKCIDIVLRTKRWVQETKGVE